MRDEFTQRMHGSPEYRQEQLSAALDGMLTPNEQAALEMHLAGCETCARELEELRQVRALLRSLPEPALPRSFLLPIEGDVPAPALPRRVMERSNPAHVTPLRQTSRRASRTLTATRWLGTLAAILGLALFLGTLLPGFVHQDLSYGGAAAPVLDSKGSQAAAGRTATLQSAPAPTHSDENGATAGKTATATLAGTAPPYSLEQTPAANVPTHYDVPGPQPGDILRTVALILVVAGVGLALFSLIGARRL